MIIKQEKRILEDWKVKFRIRFCNVNFVANEKNINPEISDFIDEYIEKAIHQTQQEEREKTIKILESSVVMCQNIEEAKFLKRIINKIERL